MDRIAIAGCGGSGKSPLARELGARLGGGQHGAIGVYDRINWAFIRYVVGYRRHMAPRVRQLIHDHAGSAEVVVLRRRRDVRRYLSGMAGVG